MIDSIRDWYLSLARREQILVASAAVLLVVVVFYGLILRPLYTRADVLRERVQSKEQERVEIDILVERILASKGSGQVSLSNEPLIVLINRTAKDKQIQLGRTEPQDVNTVRVRIESVPFNPLIEWIGQLQMNNGVEIQNIRLSRGTTEGTTTGSLTLRLAPIQT